MAENSVESNFVSMKPAVQFVHIMDQYCYNEDLTCYYIFNDYSPQEGDRIAIFKLGWNFVKDYVVFEWAPIDSVENVHTVVFNKHALPKNNIEMYQICYLSGENELYGASPSFQFTSTKNYDNKLEVPSALPFVENKIKTNSEVTCSLETELKHLREENALYRNTLKILTAEKSPETMKNYEEDIKKLYEITDSLKTALSSQEKEINILKLKIVEAGEEYKKIYVEKYKIEKKYDQLKSKKESNSNCPDSLTFEIDDLGSIPPFPLDKE